MSSRQRLRRAGYADMTPAMMQVLTQLAIRDDVGYVWLALPRLHAMTEAALRKRDWIFVSQGLDGTRYTITTRGVKALQHYQKVVKRTDGICPECGVHPVGYSRTGKRLKYCRDCLKVLTRRKNKRNFRRYGQLCPTCGIRERYVMPCGKVAAHCQECRRIASKAAYHRKKQQAYDSQ